MELALIIVGGLVAMMLVGTTFDYLGKRNAGIGKDASRRLEALEARQEALERALRERDEEIGKLKSDLSFVNRLIEDKSQGRAL